MVAKLCRYFPYIVLIAVISYSWSGLLYFSFSPAGFNIKRVLLSLFFLVLLAALVLSRSLRDRLFSRMSSLPTVAVSLWGSIMLWGLLASWLSAYPERGILEVSSYMLLLLSALVISVVGISERAWFAGLLVIGVAIGLYSLGYVFQYLLHLEYEPGSWMYSIYQFSHPRTMNHAQGWLTPLVALLPLYRVVSQGLLRWLLWFPVTAMYFFLLVSAGRGLPLMLTCSLLLTFLVFRKESLALLVVHLKSVLMAGAIYLVFIQMIPWIAGNGFESVNLLGRIKALDSGRLELWSAAWEAIKINPWFGVGPQHYITLMEYGPGSPHNILLQWACEWGIYAAAGMTVLGLWAVFSYQAQLKKRLSLGDVSGNQGRIQVALFTAMVTSGGHSLISGVFITPLSQLLMILVYGMAFHFHFVGYKGKQVEHEKIKRAPFAQMTMGTLVGMLALAYMVIVFYDFIAGYYPLYIPMEGTAPRFWLNGRGYLL